MIRRALLLSLVSGSSLQAAVLPGLSKPLPAVGMAPGEAPISIALDDYFTALPVNDQVVRFTYVPPDGSAAVTMDFALFSQAAPLSVANFLTYVNSGAYNNSFVHRSVPSFVMQGGGFKISAGNVNTVPTNAAVKNEFGISNTFGTVAMAKLGGDPNSATSQWFVNLVDNSANLDAQNGGFTVFAKVTHSSLAALSYFTSTANFPIWNAGSPFDSIPVYKTYTSGNIPLTDLLTFSSVALAPMNAADVQTNTALSYSVATSGTGVATAALNGHSLVISPTAATSGNVTVLLTATDSQGNVTTGSLVVSPALAYSDWRTANFSATDAANDAVSGPAADPDGDGVSNLELFLHGLAPGATAKRPVAETDSVVDGAHHPQFTFNLRLDRKGASYTLEKSSSLAAGAAWTTVAMQEVSRTTDGPMATITVQPAETVAAPVYYRVRFAVQ